MSPNPEMPEFENSIPNNAVRLYDQADVMDDFPILKAFQQYINAEQAKARKRILALGIFFGVLTGAIIAVFVLLLVNANSQNQKLNDRLIEFAMKERAQQSAVVVQPPQDNSAILAMTEKLEEVQKKLAEAQAKADREAAVAAERERLEAAKPKGPTPEQLEIARLNALLTAQREQAAAKEKADAEKAKREAEKEKELEAYRRKHYPELYGLPPKNAPVRSLTLPKAVVPPSPSRSLDMPLDDDDAIDYFDDSADDDVIEIKKPKTAVKKQKAAKKPVPAIEPSEPQQAKEEPYIIPVEVKGRNSSFRIPLD